MDNSTQNNQTSEQVFSLTKLQELFGNYLISEQFYIYGIGPFGLLGLVLNLISLITFKKRGLANKSIFDFIRYYLYSSIILCFIFFISTFYVSPTFFKFADTIEAKIINIRISFPLFSVVYFYNCFLDLFINIERASQFLPKLNFINKFSHFKISVGLFLTSLLLNSSYFLVYTPAVYELPISANSTLKIFYLDLSSYGRSQLGQINILVIYALRDIITLFIGLGFNLTTIVLLRSFLHKKRALNVVSVLGAKHVNLKVNYMVITMSLLASLEHFLFLLTYLYYYLSNDNSYVSNVLNMVSLSFILFKQFSNFFIFLIFNKIFRCEFLNLVLRKNVSVPLNTSTRNYHT